MIEFIDGLLQLGFYIPLYLFLPYIIFRFVIRSFNWLFD